ncbi:MAG: hypothetical protein WDZ52_07010 [Pseudohongiellaceae bacterium]
MVVADGNVDTGQRYDVLSTADATRLDLGFAISNAVESPPAFVVPTSTPVPLYFTNEVYGEGLDICLSATGADSITISNENISVDKFTTFFMVMRVFLLGDSNPCGAPWKAGVQNATHFVNLLSVQVPAR